MCPLERLSPATFCLCASVNSDTDVFLECLTVFCDLMFTRVDADRLPLLFLLSQLSAGR